MAIRPRLNRCKFLVDNAAGTGDITPGAAFSSDFFTPTEAGALDGVPYTWVIEKGSDVEIFVGIYNTTGPSITRGAVENSKIGGTPGTSKLTLAGGEIIFEASAASDWDGVVIGPISAVDDRIAVFDSTTGKLIKDSGTLVADLLARTGGEMSGNITMAGAETVDGRDLSVDGTKLDGIAANANNYVHPNHTGDVASAADGATTIGDDKVTLTHLEHGAQNDILYYAGATGIPTRLAIGANSTFLKSTGASTAPVWESIPATGDMLISTYDSDDGVAEQLVGITATQTISNKTIVEPTLILKQGPSVAPTDEGDIQWDTNDDLLKIGTGSTTLTYSDDAANAAAYAALSHAHSAADITSGILVEARGGTGVAALSSISTLSGLTAIGTIGTGVWQGTIITPTYGGTNNAFTGFTGPSSTTKTFTLPNANATILTDNALVTVAQGGTGAATEAAAFAALKQPATTTATGATELATAAEFQSKAAGNLALTPDLTWDAAALTTLTDNPTISVDLATGLNFTVTLGGNRTLGNQTNAKVGQTGVIYVVQPSSGGPRTLAYGSNYKFAGGTAPVLSTAANAVDRLSYFVRSATHIDIDISKDRK